MDGSPNQSMRQTAVKSRLIGGQSPLNRHLTGHQQPPRNFAPTTHCRSPQKTLFPYIKPQQPHTIIPLDKRSDAPRYAPMQLQEHKKRPRYKHDRSQSNINPTNPPTSRAQNPSKIQANVLFVYFATLPIFTANPLTYRNFQAILAHSILYISFPRP